MTEFFVSSSEDLHSGCGQKLSWEISDKNDNDSPNIHWISEDSRAALLKMAIEEY